MGGISIQSEGLTVQRGGRTAFAFVLFAFLVYAGVFIFRTSFVVSGERYFSLFDDAMVSMRYARHLAAGLGLVWNPGERVEGYTNPLWVFFMAGARLLPIPLSKISLVVQVAAAILLALNLAIVHRIALMVSDGSEATAIGAVVLTGWYLPLNNWGLQGMEVSALVVVVSAAGWLCLRSFEGDEVLGALYALLGASTWIRPDMAVPLAAIGCFMALADIRRRRMHVVWAGGALLIGIASQTAFRLWYFGAPFPNTYYLKMTGYAAAFRIARGMYVLLQFVWKANPVLFALVLLRLPGRDRRHWLLAFVMAVQIAYSVYVGGDAWEYWGGANRYIAIAIPAFFVLLSDALRSITRRNLAFACLVGVCLLSVNSISGPGALAELFLIKAPLHSGPGDENARDVAQALVLEQVTAPDASIAVTRAGTLPYFSDRRGVDILGKADTRIAREASRVPGGARRFMDFRPGHTKWDDAYSIGELQPDVIMQIWGDRQEAARYMGHYAPYRIGPDCVYARTDSSRVDVARLESCHSVR